MVLDKRQAETFRALSFMPFAIVLAIWIGAIYRSAGWKEGCWRWHEFFNGLEARQLPTNNYSNNHQTKRMKQLITYCAIGLFSYSIVACNGAATDAKKEADSSNNAMVDSAKKSDTVAGQTSHTADMKDDAAFAVAAADGGQLEVDLGKMAVANGTSKQIKALGAMMLKDHSKANKELKAIAEKKNITLPTALSDKCQKTKDDLSAKKGADFDKAYADLMVSDHKTDIDDFKSEADKGVDSTLKTFARTTLPTLEHHLMMAEAAKKATDK